MFVAAAGELGETRKWKAGTVATARVSGKPQAVLMAQKVVNGRN
ncbi:MAG TPA: hypothetical protein VFK96_09755 [Gammaproteobacteria bacterium]|nr:hypothetical protein [Gammaproteobacteria bacterium]